MKHGRRVNREYEYRESEDKYEMAWQWIDQNKLVKAEECLKRTIDLNENFIYAYVTLAEVYRKLSRPQDGIRVLKRAWEADPDFDRLPFMMADLALETGDFVSALRFIERAVSMNPAPDYQALQERIRSEMSMINK